MKVRERLFLRVGGLFFVVFSASMLLQYQIISKIFLRAEKKLHADFVQFDEQKLNSEQAASALVNRIEAGISEVLHDISFEMRLVACGALVLVLLLLHNIARQLTRPIMGLARAAGEIEKGKLDGIILPKLSPKRRDEIAALRNAFENMIIGLKEKEKVKGVLNKVVSPEIANEILKGNVHLGGEERIATTFFADIRNFTHMTQNMTPEEVINMLNACMTRVSRVIDAHGGVIDKYVGDEVMALFGAPIEHPESPLNAIRCALEIIEELKRWNEERKTQGLPAIEMGIGLHTGPVLAGNMGAENRLNYTVLGRSVNLAARLCSAAKPMQILISKQTLEVDVVSGHIEVDELSPMELKGFDQAIVTLSVKGEKK